MKKLVTVLLVVAMVLSLASVAFADTFSDISDQANTAKASITKLNALDVINGYPDGTFKPANTITRAEFAKISVIMAGLQDSVSALNNANTTFSDVKAGVWYTGYVSLAASQGFVKGFPDGTFRPNANITYAEVVTVLLRVAGYNDNLPGPWPVDYIAKAAKLDITDDVAFNATAPATRGDVAVMTDGTLETEMMYWDKDEEDFLNKTKTVDDEEVNVTLLDKNFDSQSGSGLVTDVTWSSQNEKGTLRVTIKGAGAAKQIAEDAKVGGVSDFFFLEGAVADYVLNDDGDLAFAAPAYGDYTVVKDNAITYTAATHELEIDDSTYDVNMNAAGDAEDVVIKLGFADSNWAGIGTTADQFTVVLNDDDEVIYVKKSGFAVAGAVDEVEAADKYVAFTTGTSFTYDEDEDANDSYLFVKNGKIIDFDEINAGDIYYNYSGNKNRDAYYVFVDSSVSGVLEKTTKLDAADYDTITVAGTEYDVDPDVIYSTDGGDSFDTLVYGDLTTDALFDETVKVVCAANGEVVALVFDEEGTDVAKNYGIATYVTNDFAVVDGEKDYVKIMNSEGAEVLYEVTDDSQIYDTVTAAYVDWDTDVDDITAEVVEDNLLEYTISDDGKEIAKIKVVGVNKTAADASANRIMLGGILYEVPEGTPLFTLANADNETDVITWASLADYFANDDNDDLTLNAVLDGNKVKALVATTAFSIQENAGMVLAKGENSDGWYVTLLVGNEQETYNTTQAIYDLLSPKNFIEYTLSNDEISGTAVVADADFDLNGTVFTVSKVSGSSMYIKDAAGNYYYWTDATVVYDVTGDDPECVTTGDFAMGQTINIWVEDGELVYAVITAD